MTEHLAPCFKARVRAVGIRDRPTSFRSPWRSVATRRSDTKILLNLRRNTPGRSPFERPQASTPRGALQFAANLCAAGAFLASSIIVWTTTFGIGHFGNASFPLDDRVLQSQTAILFLAVSAYIQRCSPSGARLKRSLLARMLSLSANKTVSL